MADPIEPATAGSLPLLRPERLCAADVCAAREPFPYLIATDTIADHARAALRTGFPASRQAGFLPHEPTECGVELNQLIGEITAPAFADSLGNHLGVRCLSDFPVLVTVCTRLNKRHGTIHTDSRSKVASALLYFNDDWVAGSHGSLRLLANDKDIGSLLTPEIPPLYGTLVAFKRADDSFHGHLPFEGERRVIQFAWLTDHDALARKTHRGRMQRLFKRVFGPLDRWLGARRGVNKAHRN